MKTFTSSIYRKVIGLILVLLAVTLLIVPTALPLDETGNSLWRSIFSASSGSAKRIGYIVLAGLVLLTIILLLLTLPSIFKKGGRGQYPMQLIITMVIIGLSVFATIGTKQYNATQLGITMSALAVNTLSSVYYILCLVFNYDEMNFVKTVIYEDEVKEVSDNGNE